ncbi:Abi family protein [Oxalobacter sp. OttesenSCG-928-P03]|nr:Abi family protein [Oxalobacter sp. OttesenSCG-928-P03]
MPLIPYSKPALTIDQQADLLIRRGLAGDRNEIKKRLASVGYYRLSAYWYPYREWAEAGQRADQLQPGTSISLIWDHYVFDRRLRLLLFDAIERIEIALRSSLSYRHAEVFGPFGYPNNLTPDSLDKVKINESFKKQYTFVDHFSKKYQGDLLPVWMAVGLMDIGVLLELLRASPKRVQDAVCRDLAIPFAVLNSWWQHLRVVRNACAHHARVWNNVWGVAPRLPHMERAWRMQYSEKANKWINDRNHESFSFVQNRTGISLMICRTIMKNVAKTSKWKNRVEALFQEFEGKGINFSSMGLPNHWQEHPLWR